MSRVHTVRSSVADIAAKFGAIPAPGLIVPSETREGLPGLVVFEKNGTRHLTAMTWGFPRLTLEMHANGDEPGRVGLVANLTNPMWKKMVVQPRYRCLIPVTHFANPDGTPGAKTRTWFSVKDQPIVAWAGFCRNIIGDGPVYAGMTMAANAAIPPTNDRMPVLLDPQDYDAWLHGGIQDVIAFMYRAAFLADRMEVVRSEDAWRSGEGPPGTGRQLPLL